MLRDISHDNNEIANSCIIAQDFLLLLTLQYNIIHVWESMSLHTGSCMHHAGRCCKQYFEEVNI